MNQAAQNRRLETRYRSLTGQLVSWQPEDGSGADRKAWILDISRQGIGLMMERQNLPAIGEVIGLRLRPDSRPIHYEVLHIQPGANRIVSMGCQRLFGRVSRIDPNALRPLARLAA